MCMRVCGPGGNVGNNANTTKIIFTGMVISRDKYKI